MHAQLLVAEENSSAKRRRSKILAGYPTENLGRIWGTDHTGRQAWERKPFLSPPLNQWQAHGPFAEAQAEKEAKQGWNQILLATWARLELAEHFFLDRLKVRSEHRQEMGCEKILCDMQRVPRARDSSFLSVEHCFPLVKALQVLYEQLVYRAINLDDLRSKRR